MGLSHSIVTAYADGCPVDHENMSPEQISSFLLNHASSSNAKDVDSASTSHHFQDNQRTQASTGSPVGCPVDHENMSPEQIAAFLKSSQKHLHDNADIAQGSEKTSGKVPPYLASPKNNASAQPREAMKSSSLSDAPMYDVYGQPLDPDNLMPSTPNQLPSPGQKEPLSTDRAASTIPKSGGASTWIYPSPQMFYNALKRKGKGADVEESDIPSVVAVHNKMNEKTWAVIQQWEAQFHCDECKNPKLKRFQGRPHDLSPAARFRMYFRGYPRPFDRHDWIIDRCGQSDARYIIDYYYTDNGPDPIEIHVRPAIDSFSAAYDRLRFGLNSLQQFLGRSGSPLQQENAAAAHAQSSSSELLPPPIVKGDALDEDEFTFLTELTPGKIRQIADDVQTHCTSTHQAYANALTSSTDKHDEELEQAHISLNYCMAQHICKRQATEFIKALEAGKDPSFAYGLMTSCLDRFQIMARRTFLEAAGISQSGPEFPAGVVPSVAHSPGDTSYASQPS